MAKLSFLDKLDKEQLEYAAMVGRAAKEAGVPPALAISIAYQESKLRPNVKDGDAGEIGLMQVMPPTGKDMGYSEKDLRDVEKNIAAGIRYLKQGLDATDNDPRLTAAYYNGGPGAFQALASGQKPDDRVISYLKSLKGFGTFEGYDPNAAPEAPKPAVQVNEPTEAQLRQIALDEEMAGARETAAEQKPMSAVIGAGAGFGAATAKSAVEVKQGLGRLAQQMSQQAPPMGPQAAPPSPMAPQGNNQATRILQGTTGDLGTTGRARMTGFNVETSQQAAAKEQAEKIAQMLRQTGQVPQGAPEFFSQQPGLTSTPSGVLAPRSDLPRYLGPRGPQGQIGGVRPPAPVPPKMSGLDATKDLFVSMMKSAGNIVPTMDEYKNMASNASRVLGRLPYISGPLAGAQIGYEFPELEQGLRVSQPDYTDVGLTGLGMLSTLGSFIPPVAPLAIPLSIGAPMLRDVRRRRQEIERNPSEYRDTIMKSLSDTDPMGNPMP